MQTTVTPIATSTILSVLLHGIVLVVLLLVYQQTSIKESAAGSGIDVQLISSEHVSTQLEADVARKKSVFEPLPDTLAENTAEPEVEELERHQAVVNQLSSNSSALEHLVPMLQKQDSALEKSTDDPAQAQKNIDDGDNENGNELALITQSTNAASQQHAILALLHESISSNKEYPYIARRQRREGVATVGFVLHPDGSIRNTHLVSSSSAGVLDRAAITAVKRIEPFEQAHDYLERAEEFKIDVVFNLL